jgi:hypothetical protein
MIETGETRAEALRELERFLAIAGDGTSEVRAVSA